MAASFGALHPDAVASLVQNLLGMIRSGNGGSMGEEQEVGRCLGSIGLMDFGLDLLHPSNDSTTSHSGCFNENLLMRRNCRILHVLDGYLTDGESVLSNLNLYLFKTHKKNIFETYFTHYRVFELTPVWQFCC